MLTKHFKMALLLFILGLTLVACCPSPYYYPGL
jgi:hypothetical protein